MYQSTNKSPIKDFNEEIEEVLEVPVEDINILNTDHKYGDPFTDNLFSKDKPSKQDEEDNKETAGVNVIKYKMKDFERDTFLDLEDIKGQISQVNKNMEEIERKNIESNSHKNLGVSDLNQPQNIQPSYNNLIISPEKATESTDVKHESPENPTQKAASSFVMTPGHASVVSIDRKNLIPTTLEEIYRKKNDLTSLSLNTSTLSPYQDSQKIAGISNIQRDNTVLTNAWEERPVEKSTTNVLNVSKSQILLADEIQANFSQISKMLEKINNLLEEAPKDQIEKERTKIIQTVDTGLNETRTAVNFLALKGSNLLNTKFESPLEGNMRKLTFY